MKNEKLILLILAIVQFTHIIDFMIIMPLGKQIMEIFAISPQQFSMIVSAYSFAAFGAGIIGAFLIDRYDRKQALLFAYIGFTVGTVACALSPNFELFLAARSFAGFFGGTIATLILSIIGDIIPYERRATAMGIIMTAFSVASVFGVPAGLFIAAEFGWKMPFYTVAGISVLGIIAISVLMPPIRIHLEKERTITNPFKNFAAILKESNQLRALLFTIILVLGHFTIIPFIAPYMQMNIGFSDSEIAYIYLFGGLSTIVALPLFGRLGDRFGNFNVFALASIGAIFSIWGITNLQPVAMYIAILVTTSYFIVASGRNVPATTMVTAVVKAENRGSFMSLRTSAQQLALALSSLIAGLIVTKDNDGALQDYDLVGYLAIGMSIVAVWMASKLKVVKEDGIDKQQPTIENENILDEELVN
jgi:predicted MFS family arabinose efflux permease